LTRHAVSATSVIANVTLTPQRIVNLVTRIHHLTVERSPVMAAPTSRHAAISSAFPMSRFLARVHTRDSRCV
jgi:hypothetical protein